jgi:hypothetical protein
LGIDIILERGKGDIVESVSDPTNTFHRVLPPLENKNFCCINRIDQYGNTVFNRLQVKDVRNELLMLLNNMQDANLSTFIGQIVELTKRVEAEPHLYLKFVGD